MLFKLFILTFLWSGVALAGDSAPVSTTAITNEEETRTVGIELINGKNRLLTSSVTIIEALFGRDPQATTWYYIGTADDASGVGNVGDTVTTTIPAAVSPLNTVYPAVSVITTVTLAHTQDSNPERALAITICQDMNGDANFQTARWKCEVIKDMSGIFISSRLYNEFGKRTEFGVVSTGLTVTTKAFLDILPRGFETELDRSPNDPRKGVLAISGSVRTSLESIGDKYFSYLLNGASQDLLVDGSTVPVVFRIDAIADKRIVVEDLKCFGGGNGIKFGQFLSKSGAGGITNGLQFEIRSQATVFTFPTIHTTDDFKNLFATSATDFRLDIQSGLDQFLSIFSPAVPYSLEPIGTVAGGNDYIKVTVQDDISSGISSLECAVFGFEEDN